MIIITITTNFIYSLPFVQDIQFVVLDSKSFTSSVRKVNTKGKSKLHMNLFIF